MEKSYATQGGPPGPGGIGQPEPGSLAPDDAGKLRGPAGVARLVLAKAEGNPFFLEELALTVVQHGEPHAGGDRAEHDPGGH